MKQIAIIVLSAVMLCSVVTGCFKSVEEWEIILEEQYPAFTMEEPSYEEYPYEILYSGGSYLVKEYEWGLHNEIILNGEGCQPTYRYPLSADGRYNFNRKFDGWERIILHNIILTGDIKITKRGQP